MNKRCFAGSKTSKSSKQANQAGSKTSKPFTNGCRVDFSTAATSFKFVASKMWYPGGGCAKEKSHKLRWRQGRSHVCCAFQANIPMLVCCLLVVVLAFQAIINQSIVIKCCFAFSKTTLFMFLFEWCCAFSGQHHCLFVACLLWCCAFSGQHQSINQ